MLYCLVLYCIVLYDIVLFRFNFFCFALISVVVASMVSPRVELCCVVWWIVWCDELIISNRILVESMNGVVCGGVMVYVCLSVSYRGNFAFVNQTIDLSVCQSVSVSLYLPLCACVHAFISQLVSLSVCWA